MPGRSADPVPAGAQVITVRSLPLVEASAGPPHAEAEKRVGSRAAVVTAAAIGRRRRRRTIWGRAWNESLRLVIVNPSLGALRRTGTSQAPAPQAERAEMRTDGKRPPKSGAVRV
nr:hypothetical protein KitaXyl93_41820 [Kitasatospora sp. Xyl93]